MVLKLYGSPTSTCTKRVATILYLKKIPHELIAIDLAKKEHKDAAYMEKQPFGQVPYIDDDGLILFESRAICRYLEEKYPDHGPTFIPKDAKGKAMFEQAASIEMMTFDPCASKAGYEGFIKK
ncbi:hypothetical protein VKT23_008619 [Stygiomarasmius scandens]|uniref:glutathione transferase n=1 Tax=Marasmiellus scandens TaxID=2682957 RepID=A0ABR1JM92_9AGAR